MARVLCIGDACADIIIPYGKSLKGEKATASFSCGGANANSAYVLSKLGIDVSFFGKAGNDLYGRAMKKQLADSGADVSHFILSDDLVSTQVLMVLDEDGERHPFLMPKDEPSYLQIHQEDFADIDLKDIEYILTNGMMFFQEPAASSILSFLHKAHDQGIKIVLDINYRIETADQDDTKLKEVIAISDILLGSIQDDLLPLCGTDDIFKIPEILDNEMIVVHDAKGAYVFSQGKVWHADSFPVKIKDSTGAGDAFNAGFMYGLISSHDLKTCAVSGCAAAALCIQHEGTRFPIDEEILLSFIAQSAR